jgi:hypothetical protein
VPIESVAFDDISSLLRAQQNRLHTFPSEATIDKKWTGMQALYPKSGKYRANSKTGLVLKVA